MTGMDGQPRGVILAGLGVVCLALAGCDDRGVDLGTVIGQAGEADSSGIEWHAGSVKSAFALARSQGTPVLLYWGTDWCPPCSRLKATVFNRPEFIDRSRMFIPVNLDGDDPGAQKLGEKFDVSGYPTVIVFSPEGEEITRIPLALDLERYVEALDVALAATRPVADAYAAALRGVATAADYRLLAYYSWYQDEERLVPKTKLAETLRELHARIRDELAVERSLLFIQYLNAYSRAASEHDRDPTLPAEERAAAQERMIEILIDPALTRANHYYVVYGAHRLLPMIAQQEDAGRTSLEDAWEAALARIRKDPRTSSADLVGTYFGEICLARALQPDALLPASLVRTARRAVLNGNRETEEPYARLALFSSTWLVLNAVGLHAQATAYAVEELERSHSPDTIMTTLGAYAQHIDDDHEALRWMEDAWNAATGPATRFQRGVAFVRTLLILTPDDVPLIEETSIELFRDVGAEKDAFFQRTTGRMDRLETALSEWNADGTHDPSLARIRSEVLKICATIPAGDPSRTNCEAFLSSLEGRAPR